MSGLDSEEAPHHTARRSARPTARESHTGRWPRSSTTSSRFATRTRRRRPGRKLRSGVTSLMSEARRPGRRASLYPACHPAGPRAARATSPLGGRPAADARARSSPPPAPSWRNRKPAAAGFGDRRHPLGRRGNARPDRPPDALGAGSAPARLPRPGRAARAAPRLGRGSPQRDDDRARAAHRERDAGAGPSTAAGAWQRGRGRRSAGRRALRRQPLFAEEMVNRLLEEETVEADALPSTVQSLLAAASTRSTGSRGGCSNRPR